MPFYMQAYDGTQTVYYVVDAFDDEPVSTVPTAVGPLTRKRRLTSNKNSSALPIVASQTLLGRKNPGTGPIEALTPTVVVEMLGLDAYVTDEELATALSSIGTTSQTSQLFFLAINTMIGTVPRLVGSTVLPAGNYQAPSALLGPGEPAYSATLTLETPTGDVLSTIGGVSGGVAWRTASTGFELTEITLVEVVLVCSAAGQPAFVHGLSIIQE